MGGREVGGLANMLAAHMGFSPPERDRVERFWSAPRLVAGEGLKAVQMFDAVAQGRIRALWVMGTNPSVSIAARGCRPRGARAARLPGDLGAGAAHRHRARRQRHPAARPGLGREGRHRHQFRAPDLPPAGVPRSARRGAGRLGGSWRRWRLGSASARPSRTGRRHTIFREHAALSAFENDGARDFDLGGIADLSDDAYAAARAAAMAARARRDVGQAAVFFADGGFFTPDGRARFVAVAPPKLARRRRGRDAVPAQHRAGCATTGTP